MLHYHRSYQNNLNGVWLVQHFHFNSFMLFWLISHRVCTIRSYGETVSHITLRYNWNLLLSYRNMKYSRCSADFNMSNAAIGWFLKCVANIHLVLPFKLNIYIWEDWLKLVLSVDDVSKTILPCGFILGGGKKMHPFESSTLNIILNCWKMLLYDF